MLTSGLPLRRQFSYHLFLILWGSLFLSASHFAYGQKQVLGNGMYHLRNGEAKEWDEFHIQPEGRELELKFVSKANKRPKVLEIRQRDVRQQWQVMLNGLKLGNLVQDEKDMVIYLEVPANAVVTGENIFKVVQNGSVPDDVMAGEVILHDRSIAQVLSEAIVFVEVLDVESNALLPSRLTITNEKGVLQTVGNLSTHQTAMRPGYIYSLGKASFSLPAGKYTLYAGRGFEYGIDSIQLEVKAGDRISHQFKIRREVNTDGWISSDTHIHTFTHSGHGDATVEERILTIASEGIELPVITEHNLQIDIQGPTRDLGLDTRFTPVVGNEVTTKVGHFNIFPVASDGPVADYKGEDWGVISQSLKESLNKGGVILNHARDFHSRFRPFGQERHIAIAGLNLDGWQLPANAMEVINSGALKTDMMQLYNDWFGMLNRGYFLTPVGSSDSHDVSRFHVGQARTYIRSRSENMGDIDVKEAVENFRQGNVMVSFGLLAQIKINNRYGPGDLVPASDDLNISVSVQGPGWVKASRVALYANGQKIREEAIGHQSENASGVKWRGEWTLPAPDHDLFLVAVAEGPGMSAPFWPIPKPYQADSPAWVPSVMGSSGAVWIDADKDGHRTSAYDYAKELLETSNEDISLLIGKLAVHDEAVAIQVAALLDERGILSRLDIEKILLHAAPATRSGFMKFVSARTASRQDH